MIEAARRQRVVRKAEDELLRAVSRHSSQAAIDRAAENVRRAMPRRFVSSLICLALLSGCSPPEEHRIPAGVQGDIYILTGYASGVPPKREGRSIVFEIPATQI